MKTLLKIRGLRKVFNIGDQSSGVQNLDLDIAEGEGFSIVGPSGCGKTTTLRMIGGFETPDSGSIYLGERDLLSMPAHKRPVRTVFQKYALFPHLSVFENIVFGLRMAKKSESQIKAAAEEILELTQIRHLLGRSVSRLSGGEQQRVALARALITEPEVLLLDEPLSALDLKLRERMQMELLRLRKTVGSTFIFVTHDQNEAMVLSDRIGVMNQGRLEQVGSTHEIYARPKTKFVATFIGVANFLDSRQMSLLKGASHQLPARSENELWMVRPESINLVPVGSSLNSGFVGLPVRVMDTVFLGTDWLSKVVDACGVQHLVKTPGYEPVPGHENDDRWMIWEVEDTWTVDGR